MLSIMPITVDPHDCEDPTVNRPRNLRGERDE